MGVGCGESGTGTGSHFRGMMFGGGISQGVAGHPGYTPEQLHPLEMGRVEQSRGHELIRIYFNDRPNGFWVNPDVIGFAPMTLLGLKPSFQQGCQEP